MYHMVNMSAKVFIHTHTYIYTFEFDSSFFPFINVNSTSRVEIHATEDQTVKMYSKLGISF